MFASRSLIPLRDLGRLLQAAAAGWQKDNASRLGAALAYYTTFSIGPLLLITLAIADRIFGEAAARGRLFSELRDLLGTGGADAIQAMLSSARHQDAGTKATIVGTIMLLFGATGAFGALQDALNTVWGVQTRSDRSVWDIVRERSLPFLMMVGTAFLILVSLLVSAGFAVVARGNPGMAPAAVNFLISYAVSALLFAMIFKFMPDAVVAWRHVWFGSIVTALLFSIGKLAIGSYIGRSAFTSAYGATGSLAALLVWLYYSSQIFLFGVELTKVHAQYTGAPTIPSPNAKPMPAERRNNSSRMQMSSGSADRSDHEGVGD